LFIIHYNILEYFLFILFNLIILYMGKSRRKSRKYKGGNLTSVDCAKNPQLCPTQTEHGGSLMKMAAASTKQQAATAASQSIASKHLASGGGKKKKGGTAKVICPQPAAGSGGSIPAGGSSAGANMCHGVGTSQQQSANAIHDSTAKDLSTAPPCNPFTGQCGGKKRRRKTRRRRGRKSRRRKSLRRKSRRRKKRKRTRKKMRRKRRS
jgi:hypothetical protein